MTDFLSQPFWSRRKFLKNSAIAGSTALFSNPLSSWAIQDIDPKVAAIVAATLGVDSHNHIDVPLEDAEMPGQDIDLSGEMKRSGLAAICMTFAVDYQKLPNVGDGYRRFLNGLKSMDRQLALNKMNRALNFAELEAAHKANQPTVIQSVEGCHFLEGRLERVEEAYKHGLRHIGLLHDNDASVPLGDVFTNEPKHGGLTDFGAQVIKESNRLGMLVDLAHGSDETVNAALKLSQRPIIISHTGLNTRLGNNPNMARMMAPRLISKEQAKIVAEAGGIIGVWTHLADTPLEYAANIRALVDVIGIDHVCIGTDTKLTPGSMRRGGPPPRHIDDSKDDHSENRPNGNPSMGEQNGPRFGERTNQIWQEQKNGFYYTVVDALLKTGFNAHEIGKIGGGNFCRVFDLATKHGLGRKPQ